MTIADIQAITCETCAGAVVLEPGRRVPRCLYCGSEKLVEEKLDERIEQPELFIAFAISPAEADNVFRKFTRSSFWYPGEIRNAQLKLEKLLLPAWAWSAAVETHFAALVKASTRSGKAPVAGQEHARLEGIVVPSSTALTRAELGAIAPFQHKDEQPFDPALTEDPWEPGRLSRTAAREQAVEAMNESEKARLKGALSASKLSASCICTELEGRPVLLPIYIGAWRFKDKVYRVLINGQTGRLHGKAPISWVKVAAVVLAVLATIGFIALVVGVVSTFAR